MSVLFLGARIPFNFIDDFDKFTLNQGKLEKGVTSCHKADAVKWSIRGYQVYLCHIRINEWKTYLNQWDTGEEWLKKLSKRSKNRYLLFKRMVSYCDGVESTPEDLQWLKTNYKNDYTKDTLADDLFSNGDARSLNLPTLAVQGQKQVVIPGVTPEAKPGIPIYRNAQQIQPDVPEDANESEPAQVEDPGAPQPVQIENQPEEIPKDEITPIRRKRAAPNAFTQYRPLRDRQSDPFWQLSKGLFDLNFREDRCFIFDEVILPRGEDDAEVFEELVDRDPNQVRAVIESHPEWVQRSESIKQNWLSMVRELSGFQRSVYDLFLGGYSIFENSEWRSLTGWSCYLGPDERFLQVESPEQYIEQCRSLVSEQFASVGRMWCLRKLFKEVLESQSRLYKNGGKQHPIDRLLKKVQVEKAAPKPVEVRKSELPSFPKSLLNKMKKYCKEQDCELVMPYTRKKPSG